MTTLRADAAGTITGTAMRRVAPAGAAPVVPPEVPAGCVAHPPIKSAAATAIEREIWRMACK